MTKLLAALMLILTPAQAFQCRIPPAQFDHEPARPYRVVLDHHLRGNAFTSADRSTIVLPAHATPAWKSCYLRHEKGHVNGWGAHHPGLRHVR